MIAAIILAAGLSARARGNKLLAEKNGRAMIAHSVGALKTSRVDEIIIVTGHDADKIRKALGNECIHYIYCPDYASGMAASIATGVGTLRENITAALICLADMPNITPDHINRIIQNGSDQITFPIKNNVQGHPVLWPRRFFPDLIKLSGDRGAKALLKQNQSDLRPIEMIDDACFTDCDDEEAIKQWQLIV